MSLEDPPDLKILSVCFSEIHPKICLGFYYEFPI